MQPRTKITALVAAVALAGVLVYVTASRPDARSGSSPAASVTGSDDGAAFSPQATADSGTPTSLPPNAVVSEGGVKDAGPNVRLVARWGSGRGDLGRDRPSEGNPEGPMSLALAGKDLLVLDQVNGRLLRYDADGRLRSSTDAPTTVQDIAVGKDGTVAMVDRLVGKSITLVGPSGAKIGELPLGPRVGEPGLVTAVVVDGKNVYVEKEHGALVLVGGIDGRPADEAVQLTGRPSKDGALLLTAGLSSKQHGRAYLNAVDRKTASLRFARAIQFPAPSQAIVLLDSDAKGVIYLGAAAGDPGDAHITCLDPGDGHVVGRTMLPLSHTPEESFRDFTVGEDGTIAYAVRTDDGVQYRTATCP